MKVLDGYLGRVTVVLLHLGFYRIGSIRICSSVSPPELFPTRVHLVQPKYLYACPVPCCSCYAGG